MALTIEWLIEHSSQMVMRLDLTRKSFGNYRLTEAVKAAFIFYRGDEEGSVLGMMTYEAPEGCSGRFGGFKCSARREEWTTMVGDFIAPWDREWRVEGTTLCRLGEFNRELDRLVWTSLTPQHLIMMGHLSRLWGAVEQFAQTKQGDESWVLQSASEKLRNMIANQVSGIRSWTQHL